MSNTEWEQRFRARIVERLTGPDSTWTVIEAERAAASEFHAVEFEEIYDGFEDDPEGSADECLSYWGDGA